MFVHRTIRRTIQQAIGIVIYAWQAIVHQPVDAASFTVGSILDTELLNEIQYHMVETPNSGASFGSGLWSTDEVLNYINNRQRQFMAETGVILKQGTLTTTANQKRHALPQDFIEVTRAVWRTASRVRYGLTEADDWEIHHGQPTWEYVTAMVPSVYNVSDVPQLQIEIAPASYDDGVLELTYVALTDEVDGTGIYFSVPDEFLPIIKWGVMADMLSKIGRGQDAERAEYCEQRYQEGVAAAQVMLGGDEWQTM